MRKSSFKLLIIGFIFTTCGCAGFPEYRREQVAKRQTEADSANTSDWADSLWKQGYGYNNPNPERQRQGLESQNFDGSLESEKKKPNYFATYGDDMISYGFEAALKSVFSGLRKLVDLVKRS